MDSATLVLFGATGDLAKRKIYPALFNLFLDKKMPEAFSVIGLGRRELSDEAFQSRVAESVAAFSRRAVQDPQALQAFLSAFRYSTLNIDDADDYRKLLELTRSREEELNIPGNRMFYMSVAPEFFSTIALNLQQSGLTDTRGWKKLLVEKPFGRDLQSARELNRRLGTVFKEEEIYRIDHYLGKPMVQNLEILESANPILQAVWSNHYIANVQITAAETVGVEERAGYYDQAGAIRDMFQNHMLQLLMMTAMQLPKQSSAEEVRFKKKKVLESLRPLQKEDVPYNVVRGRYAAGQIQGKPVAGYTDEPGVAAGSRNDTFIAARLWIDDYFWNEVPFYIRTGKRMKEKSTRIVIEFKEPLKAVNKLETYVPNLLVIEIHPNEGIFMQLNQRNPLHGGELEPVRIDFYSNPKDLPEAYENLIYDAMRGEMAFFAHWDEVELSWQWVQPILDAYRDELVPLQEYPAGSFGPEAADQLLEADGYKWWLDSETGIHRSEANGEQYASVQPLNMASGQV